MINLRVENRIAAQEKGEATILGRPDVTVPCAITNFSRSGMCITVERDIASGTIVKVNWQENFLVGRAHRVSTAGPAFQVGLELLYCSKWTDPVAKILESREQHSG
jgi:hypothetical protein